MDFHLSEDEKQILLTTARAVIKTKLLNEPLNLKGPTQNLMNRYGAFVTIHLKGKLRGCIGHMTGVKPLFETIQELAESSAFRDPRFPPLSENEIDDIDLEITVLTPLAEISDVSRIQVGKHGIYLQRSGRSGVLLPQVAAEQGWDRTTFLKHTCIKAGLSGDCWKDPKTKISIFEGIIFGEI